MSWSYTNNETRLLGDSDGVGHSRTMLLINVITPSVGQANMSLQNADKPV